MNDKNVVVFGVLGTEKDKLSGDKLKQWRPTVDLCRQKGLPINRYELLYQNRFKSLAESTVEDIKSVSATQVQLHEVDFNNDPWDFETVYNVFYDFAKSYKFDHDKERYLVNISTGTHVMQICLFLLTEAKYFPAKLVQSPRRKGKNNEPSPCKEIDLRLNKYDKIFQRFNIERQDDISLLKGYIETKNPVFESLIKRILHVSSNYDYPILLTGKTGVGKSSLAKRIHELRVRKNKTTDKIISVNCATLRGDLLKSELFGHKKGAFTGASGDHIGFLESANEGTLFLDEIGELDLEAQTMLLTAIEDKSFRRLGDNTIIKSNFYLIAGTNCDLNERVSKGLFRKDLLARIEVFQFEMPELKDRPEDIEPNLKIELDKFSKTNNINITINETALNKYLSFAKSSAASWSNNFRDLNSSAIRMSSYSEDGRVTEHVVDEEIELLRSKWAYSANKQFPLLEKVLGNTKINEIDYFYHAQLEEVIKVCLSSKTRSEASRKLYNKSLENKKTKNDADRLIKFLKIFGLDWDLIQQTFKSNLT